MDIFNLPNLTTEGHKLPTVVVDNGEGGVIYSIEEDGVISGEVIVMQRTYRSLNGNVIEETRFARLIDDICRITTFEFNPGEILSGHIVMKQRTSFSPGYIKLKLKGRLLRSKEGNLPIWGRTYYTEDYNDKDELIVSSIS